MRKKFYLLNRFMALLVLAIGSQNVALASTKPSTFFNGSSVQTIASSQAVQQRKFTITGKITDKMSFPVIGATVTIKGTTTATASNVEGMFQLQGAKVGDILTISFIGYVPQDVTINNESELKITLEDAVETIEDIVVIGYGTQKKSSVVASINSIDASQLTGVQRNIKNALAGQVAGVIAVQRGGEPGNDGSSFWIRGQSSYAGGTNPLVLVDGVPRSMDDIDVDEIDTFTVLKDAAATAVYGSEGANGVVLITSKRGRVQKTKMTVSAQVTGIQPTRIPELLNSYEYLSLYNEGFWNERGNPIAQYNDPYSADVIEKYYTGIDPDLYPNVNWMDMLSNLTTSQRYTINFRGGNDKARFFVSGAYYNESGIFKSQASDSYNSNINLDRFNLRSNVDMSITKSTILSVDLSGQYTMRNAPGNSSDDIFSALTLFPTHLIPKKYSDGTLSDHSMAAIGRYNPYNMLNESGYSKKWAASIQSKVTLKQELDFWTEGLSAQANVSFDADFESTMNRSKKAQTYYASGRDENGNLIKKIIDNGSALGNPAISSTGGTKKIYIEASINYNRTFADKHDVTGMILYNQKETQYQNRADLALLPYRKQSVVARATYGYDSRYMIEGSVGATGSENFAAGHRWGMFPSVGAAWYVSNEKFMQKATKVISKLKVRASYGMTGNDAVSSGRFPYRESLKTDAPGYNFGMTPGNNGGGTNNPGNGIIENLFAQPGLIWEKEAKFNVGLDLGLFNGKIDLGLDWFKNERSNILIQRLTIPTASGFRQNPWENFGKTQNTGFEASLTMNHNFGDWHFTLRGNLTYAKNTVLERDEIPQIYDWLNATGQRMGQPSLYIADGLYTPDDFDITIDPKSGAKSYKLKNGSPERVGLVAPGDIKYKDLNGDGMIDSYDKSYDNGMYSTSPELVYGFGLNVSWKGITVGAFFQGVGNSSMNLLSKASNFMPFYNGVDNSSGRSETLDRWTVADPYNQNVLFPRMHATKFQDNLESSTWWYRDASFLRLKNVEISYDFPKSIISKAKINNLRVYVEGTNLFVWDKVKYWDPELASTNSGARYPIASTYTIGLSFTF